MMEISKVQKVIRKAIKDYAIESAIDEETLVAFLSVDIVREDKVEPPPAAPKPPRRQTPPPQQHHEDEHHDG